MFERFAKSARVTVALATEEAREMSARSITAEHLLLGAVAAAEGYAATVLARAGLTAPRLRSDIASGAVTDVLGSADEDALRSIGIDLAVVRARVEERFGVGALDVPGPNEKRSHGRRSHGRLSLDRHAKKILELSLREAMYRKDRSIELGHILLGLLRDGDESVLAHIDSSPDDLRLAVEDLLDREAG